MNQLNFGTRVESEHAPTYDYLKKFMEKKGHLPSKKAFFELIAQNHLAEDKNYYKKLGRCKL